MRSVAVSFGNPALFPAAAAQSGAALRGTQDEVDDGAAAGGLPRRLLVVADRGLALTIVEAVARDGLQLDLAASLPQALAHLRERSYHAAIIDLQLPGQSGLKLVTLLRTASPTCACLALTGAATVAAAVTVLESGAADFLVEPLHAPALRRKTYALLDGAPPIVESSLLTAGPGEPSFAGIVGGTPLMRQLFSRIAGVAPQATPVLISGEPGTGKHLVAQAIHELSQRLGPLVPVHATAMPADELRLHLFGQERIGPDGVQRVTAGLLERAQGGTLLFSDVAELDAGGQRCLRQLLAEPTYYRRGSTQLRRVEVRVIALTSQPLLPLVQRGRFCAELLHHLSAAWLDVPPLRQRRADIPLLAARFLSYDPRHHLRGPVELPPPTLLRLLGHHWPGNVRELRELLRQAAPPGPCLEPAVVAELLAGARPPREVRFALGASLAAVQRELILMTLAAVDGNKKDAAALLGVSRGALYSRLRTYTAQARAEWRAACADPEEPRSEEASASAAPRRRAKRR